MKFKIQYWLKSNLLDTQVKEVSFDNLGELRDYLKPKLRSTFKDYNWTVLQDEVIEGRGHKTILHSQMPNALDLMQKLTEYKYFVEPQTRTLIQLLS